MTAQRAEPDWPAVYASLRTKGMTLIITKNVGTISYEDAADGGAKFVMELPSS